jgi:hypothetical protein
MFRSRPTQNDKHFPSFPAQIGPIARPIKLLTLWIACLTILTPKTNAMAQAEYRLSKSDKVLLPPGLTETDVANGWIALFDGETLFGWKETKEDAANWRIVDKVIEADTGKASILRTTTEFDDYELKADFMASAKTNSGIFLRMPDTPGDVASDCYELNIADPSNPFPTGSFVKRNKVEIKNQPDHWQTFHVTVQGDQVTVKLGGETVNEYVDPTGVKRGYIGLQFNKGLIKFRNVVLRPLNVDSIFNGKDLSQWDDSQANESEFTVTKEGELKVIGGRGQLESKIQLADFVFSMQCRTNANGLNSGVFFRSIPGEFTNGYESQIQNQGKEGDRSEPVDCGTGGIFRRTNARRINANDQAWFSKTIVTTGNHVSVWVNGLQVTDWTDERKRHPNPRKGLRKEKGTFILQGHDPTTDILFRNIKARELSPKQ